MFYTYVLLSLKDHKLYIGFCRDLKVRFQKHQDGFVLATKNRRPLQLVYYEAYIEEEDAKRREKYLKGGNGHKDLKTQLEKYLDKVGYLQKS